jgi:hypothetical protein
MLKKTMATVIVTFGLILIIGAIALLASSQITNTKTAQTNMVDNWQITEPFRTGETLILEIKAGGDWGSVFAAGSSQTYPVDLGVTLQTSSGEEANFSCWYDSSTVSASGGMGTPILTPINATMMENNASESLEPVPNALGLASCLVKTNVNVTASLDKTDVYNNFGPVNSNGAPISPPQLTLLTDVSTYPYPYFFVPGVFLVSAGLLVFAYGVYATFRAGKRRKARR